MNERKVEMDRPASVTRFIEEVKLQWEKAMFEGDHALKILDAREAVNYIVVLEHKLREAKNKLYEKRHPILCIYERWVDVP